MTTGIGFCQPAGRTGLGRHVGNDGGGAGIQFGRLAQHAQRHHAAVGDAGDIDVGGVRDAARDQLLVQAPQEPDVIAARELIAAGIVPQAVDAFREGGGKTMRGCRLSKAGPARGQLGRDGGPVQHDDRRRG